MRFRTSTSSTRWSKTAETATRSWPLPVVLDTSALVELLLNTPKAAAVRQAIGDADVVVADLVNVEVVSTLRRLERTSAIDPGRATEAVADLAAGPLRQLSTRPLITEAWGLRDNLSAYDAFHVALARTLDCPLVTGDLRLARAPGLRVSVLAV